MDILRKSNFLIYLLNLINKNKLSMLRINFDVFKKYKLITNISLFPFRHKNSSLKNDEWSIYNVSCENSFIARCAFAEKYVDALKKFLHDNTHLQHFIVDRDCLF